MEGGFDESFDLWYEATSDPAFDDTQLNLGARQLAEVLQLSEKHEKELDRLGPSKDLTDRHFQERSTQAKEFTDERTRYAREFLAARNLVRELDQREPEDSLEPGRSYDP